MPPQADFHSMPCCRCGRHFRAPRNTAPYAAQGEGFICENCLLNQLSSIGDQGIVSEMYAKFAEILVAILDVREHETGEHSKRVACHTQVLARRFTNDPAELRQIYWGSLLHDIGKIGIPDAILLKHGPLDEAEWVVMQSHVETGYELLAALPGMTSAAELVLNHEERFDGQGYPRGLVGSDIPFGARLFAVIDTLDAMTSNRPYRMGLSFEAAKAEICRQSGRQFDPIAVDAFLAEEDVLRKMVNLKCSIEVSATHTRTV